VRTGDFRLNPEHPPLMKLWLGASMLQAQLARLRSGEPLSALQPLRSALLE
jgi:hypothetical protein